MISKCSTQEIDEDNFALPSEVKLKNLESCNDQPRLFKGYSEYYQENKNDVFMEFFNEDHFPGKTKMDEEIAGWPAHEFDVFAMPFRQNEDILGESQGYGSTSIVTNCKMLEASIALD